MGFIALFALCLLVVLIVMPIIALARANEVAKKLEKLEQEVRALRSRAGAQPAVSQPSAPPPEPEPEPEAASWERLRQMQAEIAPPATPRAEETPRAEPRWPEEQPPRPELPAEEPATPSPARDQWEVMIGGNVFNRIGAVALIIGIAFLLKYAFDHNWITPWMRILMGFAAGTALLFVGDYFHRREMRTFAQGVTGAGLAILYLSSYASLNMYHLVSQMVALVLMSAVTVAAILLSLRYDALVVTLIGMVGGFLTPVLLGGGGGSGDAFGLFAYIALLDIGLLAVALRKDSWTSVEPLTLAGTYLTYLVWHENYYTGGQIGALTSFLTLYWALFYAIDVYRSARASVTYPELRMAVAGLNAVFYYIALYNLINPVHHKWMGLITLAIGVVYLVTVLAFLRRPSSMLLVPRYSVTAIVFLVVATAIQFHGFRLVSLWAIEATLLVACGVRWRMRYVWASALGLLVITAVALISTDQAFGYSSLTGFRPILNERFLAYIVLAASLAAGASVIRQLRSEDDIEIVSDAMDYLWPIVLFTALTVETNDLLTKLRYVNQGMVLGMDGRMARWMVMAVVWAIYSLPLIWLGLRARLTPLLHLGIAVIALSAVCVALNGAEFEFLNRFRLLINFRVAAFLVVIAAVLIEYRWLARHREEHRWIEQALVVFQVGIAVLGFELITAEAHDYFTYRDKLAVWYTGIYLSMALPLMLAALWSAYSILLGWVGRRLDSSALTYAGIASLAAGVVTIALYGYGFDPIDRFTPVLNLRVASFLIVIAAVIIQRSLLLREFLRDLKLHAVLQVAASLLIFELLTVEVWDTFARTIGGRNTPMSRIESLRDMRQMAVSVTWLVYSIALMVYGIARRARTLRIVAITIFELTILKVFLYDLASLETLYRIFSFIGLGLILLATSYLYQRYKWLITGTPPDDEQHPTQ